MDQKNTLGCLAASGVGSFALLGLLILLAFRPPDKEATRRQEEVARREERARLDRRPIEPRPEPRPTPKPQPEPEERPAPPMPLAPPIKAEEKRPALPKPAKPLLIADSEPDEPPTPVPGEVLKQPVIPGYETRRINGFLMLLSTQAIKEGKRANGTPFRALTTEFDGLVRVLPTAALKPLRRVPIWIEWDNIDRLHPDTLAKYYGGGGAIWQVSLTEQIKADGVDLFSLKKLAQEKQRSADATRLVLLHELAHAAHYVFVPNGFGNLRVKLAYEQAMARRLYDEVQTARGGKARAYAATNAAEYFAELTCAYLDRCDYYPFSREELKDHDPAGYQVMEEFWGKGSSKRGKAEP